MPADWYVPSYATATLTVGLAKGDITHFGVPVAAEAGDIIGSATDPLSIGVKNVGTLAGAISLRIRDLDGATIWTGSITLAIDEVDYVSAIPSYTMPSRDLRLRTEAYHDAVVDSYMDKTVTLIVRVDTDTTLTLEPTAVEPGATYHYKGKLTRRDTDAGLGGMDIIAKRYEAGAWVDVGSGTTDTAGNYDISVTAPLDVGDVLCEAAFPGVVPFAASSAQASLGVGVLKPIWALASAALGTALIVLST
ncbi:unnamed protein product [marine sediment metagenome]|uniref:Bacterial Ig-like domain-containing protein n=1 Tax=marine sediment metagenome TaxID=412755 RepID=X1NL06_9ZZZZ